MAEPSTKEVLSLMDAYLDDNNLTAYDDTLMLWGSLLTDGDKARLKTRAREVMHTLLRTPTSVLKDRENRRREIFQLMDQERADNSKKE